MKTEKDYGQLRDEVLPRWHRLEASTKPGLEIIDFNLTNLPTGSFRPFQDRQEVASVLDELIGNDCAPRSPSDNFVLAKLRAARTFLSLLTGEQIEFSRLIEKTLGLTPYLISSDEIHEVQQSVLDSLASLGYPRSLEGADAYLEDNLITDPSEVTRGFEKAENELLPKIMRWLGSQVEVDYRKSFVNEDTFWAVWVRSNNDGELEARFNIHPSQRWTAGRIEYLLCHEVGAHLVQSLLLKKAVSDGRYPNISGFTTVFGPEQYLFEGIAQALPAFLPAGLLSSQGMLAWRIVQLSTYLMNNAHLRIHQGSELADEAKELHRQAPWISTEMALRRLEQTVKDPILKVYQYSYGVSFREMVHLAEILTPEQRTDLMQWAYDTLCTPADFRSSVLSKYFSRHPASNVFAPSPSDGSPIAALERAGARIQENTTSPTTRPAQAEQPGSE